MREINQIVQTALKGTDSQQQNKPVDETMASVLNELWKRLKANKPAWHTQLKTTEMIRDYMLEFERAFIANKVDSIEKVELGLHQLALDESPFLPAPAKFAKWCADGWQMQKSQEASRKVVIERMKSREKYLSVPEEVKAKRKAEGQRHIADLLAIVENNAD
ncbi:hypothetical protein THIOSC15_1420007 [uncultured Thiomicrorhabdus sp.]|jgi:hypothetical protein